MEDENMEITEEFSIEDLPEEVLEFILSLISPYQDLQDCMLVCKRWRRCVLNVIKAKQRNFQKALGDFDVKWSYILPLEASAGITKRYSHAALIHDNFMYIFGGCTSAMTTFNDLWKLDLSNRIWMRPLATGTYPSPKACSSMIYYNNILVIFGGWTYPPSYPLYQSWHLFNELHVYDITANLWSSITTLNSPPPVAGHSVSVMGKWMIMFGGLQKPDRAVHCDKSSDIWKLDLERWTWTKQEVQAGPKPNGRFGQTQVILDDKNLLILGGSGGPTMKYCDCWILNMDGPVWKWIEVEVRGKTNEPTNIWSNPGCKVGDKIVVLNRIRQKDELKIVYYPKSQWNQALPEDSKLSRIDLANREPDVDENVNGRRGTLKNAKREIEEESREDRYISVPGPSGIGNIEVRRLHGSDSLHMAAFKQPHPVSIKKRNEMRERRLGKLQKIEEKMLKKGPQTPEKKDKKSPYMGLYILDLSQVLSKKPVATWLAPKNLRHGPEETILYSLTEGKAELIMFGGIQTDANSLAPCSFSSQISNTLHFITAPNYVI